jgi:hypothetical protein
MNPKISTKDAAPVTDVSDREKLAFLNVVGAGEVAHTVRVQS